MSIQVPEYRLCVYLEIEPHLNLHSAGKKRLSKILDAFAFHDKRGEGSRFNPHRRDSFWYRTAKQEKRERQRQSASHYLTKQQLETICDDKRIVQKLIVEGILQPHRAWAPLIRKHPQCSYRINPALAEDSYEDA